MTELRNAIPPIHETLLIGGEYVNDGERLEVRNPARPSELVGTVVRGTPAHVDAAVAAAKGVQPTWAAKSFTERAAILDQALGRLEKDVDARAAVLVRENGKPLAQARGELLSVPIRQRMALAHAPTLDAGRELKAANGRTFVANLPYGVVVSIVPWNGPDPLAFTQVVAALLAGNCVVLKPPESCPLTLIRSAKMFAEALPPGALNVVTGLPGEIGDALTTHKDVDKIGFVGSTQAGRTIMANAAKSIKGVMFELGGNDAAILLDDVDLSDTTLTRMVNSTFMMSGQVCMAMKRVYVPSALKSEFVDKFSKAVDKLVVGDGLEPSVTLGPVHSARGLARVKGLVEDAEKGGATVMRLGKVLDEAVFNEGYFLRPTLVTDVADDASLMTEEQFAPALPITTYDDIDDAIARANDSDFGLGGSVWSRDVDKARDVARRMETGQVWINTHGVLAINHNAPYGGVKQSGIGRKSGIEGVLEYVQTQVVTTFED